MFEKMSNEIMTMPLEQFGKKLRPIFLVAAIVYTCFAWRAFTIAPIIPSYLLSAAATVLLMLVTDAITGMMSKNHGFIMFAVFSFVTPFLHRWLVPSAMAQRYSDSLHLQWSAVGVVSLVVYLTILRIGKFLFQKK